MSRSEAKELGDFIDPGQAGLVIVGESKIEDAIKHAVTRAEKQTAKELDVDRRTSTRPCKKRSRRCNRARRGQRRRPGHPRRGAAASPASGVGLPDCCRRAHCVDRLSGAEPPKENLEHHYRLTWVGFDLILVVAIYLTAHMAFRLDARVMFPATVVASLLVTDAWFDVTTSATAQAATGALPGPVQGPGSATFHPRRRPRRCPGGSGTGEDPRFGLCLWRSPAGRASAQHSGRRRSQRLNRSATRCVARCHLPRDPVVLLPAAASRSPLRASLRDGFANLNPAATHQDPAPIQEDGADQEGYAKPR